MAVDVGAFETERRGRVEPGQGRPPVALGRLETLPATGVAVCVQAVFYCQLDPDERLLWRIRGFFDAYGAGVELGILPKRGSIRERALLMIQGYGLRFGR